MTDILKDSQGHESSMRIVWAICVLTIFFTWAYICISNKQMIPFSTGDATLIGMLFGGKIGQKWIEEKK